MVHAYFFVNKRDPLLSSVYVFFFYLEKCLKKNYQIPIYKKKPIFISNLTNSIQSGNKNKKFEEKKKLQKSRTKHFRTNTI